MTLALAWLLANALVGALLLTRFAGFVIAAGWLLVGLGMIVFGAPALLIAEGLRRLGLRVPA